MKTNNQITRDHIGRRIKQLRLMRGVSQEELSQKLELSQSALSHIETGRVKPSIDIIFTCCRFFGISADVILFGKAFGTNEPEDDIDKAFAKAPEKWSLLVDEEAQASYPKGHKEDSFLTGLGRYRIPGFESAEFRIFEVIGDSMIPVFFEREFLITSPVKDYRKVINENLYVLISEEGVVVKRLFLYENGFDVFVLKSENKKYKDFTLRAKDIFEIWKVEGKITRLVEQPVSETDNSVLEKRITALEKIIYGNKD